jgi:hypothetical protein
VNPGLTFRVETLFCSEKDFWRGIGPVHGRENQEKNKKNQNSSSVALLFSGM